MRRGRGRLSLLLCSLALGAGAGHGCGGAPATAPTPPQPVSSVTEMFGVEDSGHYHPMHRAAFGPLYGSGCPAFGACGCGRASDLAAEFNCQLDALAAADIPISAYLFDGNAWSRGASSASNTCSGPGCCSWDLGDQVIARLASRGVRGLVHFWGGCHEAAQYRRVSDRLGGNLLGFYLDDGPGPMPHSFLVGDTIYAPIVTESVDSMDVELPPGEWIDYWDESRVLTGRVPRHPVPPGREPIFVRRGALIPLSVERDYAGHGTAASAGALTLLVYPDATSSFRYRSGPRGPWITFQASASAGRLTLIADAQLPGPVIYRVASWDGPPESVEAVGDTVAVSQGGDMDRAASEAEVNGSPRSAWYYHSGRHRLIIKAVP